MTYDETMADRKAAAEARDIDAITEYAFDTQDYERQWEHYVTQFLATDPRCIHCQQPITSVRDAHITAGSRLAHAPGKCPRDPSYALTVSGHPLLTA